MEDQQFAYVFTGVRLAPRCSAFTTYTPEVVVDSGPGIGQLLALAAAEPCRGGHWHLGPFIVGPDGSPQRRLTLYPGKDQDLTVIQGLADLYEKAGGIVEPLPLQPGWKGELMFGEFMRLSEAEAEIFMKVMVVTHDQEILLDLIMTGFKIEDVVRAIMDSKGDDAAFDEAMTNLASAINPLETPLWKLWEIEGASPMARFN